MNDQAVSEKTLQEAETEINLSRKIEQKTKEAVRIIGNENRYQAVLIIYFTLCICTIMYQFIGPSYFFMNPIFECGGVTTSEEEACTKLEKCVVVNDYTITAENHLYCGQKTNDRNLIQAMLGYGALVGIAFVNFFSDYQGRKFSIMLALTVQVLSITLLMIGTHYQSFISLVLSQFCAGFSSIGYLSVSYTMADKLMSKKWMSRCVLIANGVSPLAEVTMLLFTNYFNWKAMALYCIFYPTCILFFFGLFFLVEDPALLYTKGKIQESEHSLKQIAKFNRTENRIAQAFEIMEEMKRKGLEIPSEKAKSFGQSFKYLKLIGSWKIIMPILCLGLNICGLNIGYYALMFASSDVGNSYGINFLFFGIAQFVATLPLIRYGNSLPRKKSAILLGFLTFALSLIFFFSFSPTVQTILLIIMRLIMAMNYPFYVFLAVESFPQHIQSTAMGMVEIIGQPGKIVAPYVISLAQSWSLSPVGILSAIFVVTLIFVIFPLKETLKSLKTSEGSQSLLDSSTKQQSK